MGAYRMTPKERMALVKRLPCIACVIGGRLDVCGKTQVHHLNFDGKAGQKRRGDDFTIPLGDFHHQGIPKRNWTTRQMTQVYGPSLALQSKAFRNRYGKDDDLLARTNKLLGIQ